MNDIKIIDLTPENIADYGVCGYKDVNKHKELRNKIESAKKMKLDVQLLDLDNAVSVQNSPCPFGTFGIIYNGKVISHHPISNTRFENILIKDTEPNMV